jgi:AraC-like DNA-binding protein
VGISDSLYFSRLFSKVMGMSPTQYRMNKEQRIDAPQI